MLMRASEREAPVLAGLPDIPNPFDFLKDLVDKIFDQANRPSKDRGQAFLPACQWRYLGTLEAGEKGKVTISGNPNDAPVEVGTKKDDPDAKPVGKESSFTGPREVWAHLKLPEGDHVTKPEAKLEII
jgi:hypothetical protein